jgi:hypothetical protein
MPDFHAQLDRARLKVALHIGKLLVLNGVEIRAPIVTDQAGAKMGGYRRQGLDEKILLLTETQAQGIEKGMTLLDGAITYRLVQDPQPRKDGFYEVALREVSA